MSYPMLLTAHTPCPTITLAHSVQVFIIGASLQTPAARTHQTLAAMSFQTPTTAH